MKELLHMEQSLWLFFCWLVFQNMNILQRSSLQFPTLNVPEFAEQTMETAIEACCCHCTRSAITHKQSKKKNEKLNAIRRKTCRMFFCRWIKWIFLRIIYDLMIPSMALCVFVHRTESRSQNGVSLCFWFWLLCRRRASFFDKLNFVWCFLFAINQPYERWNNKSCCCCIIVDDCQKKNALSIANYCE